MTKAIKQFLEADALRTQGEWENDRGQVHTAGLAMCDAKQKVADADFIAAASRIAPDIRAMQDAFEQVCTAARMVVTHSDLKYKNEVFAVERLREALTAAAPYRKLGV
jgi:hypothetical protein